MVRKKTYPESILKQDSLKGGKEEKNPDINNSRRSVRFF